MDSKVLSSIRHAEVGRLQTLLAEHRQPVLLLGAGASVTSGVPAAGETVNRAAKWAYCKSHGRSPMDPASLILIGYLGLNSSLGSNGGLVSPTNTLLRSTTFWELDRIEESSSSNLSAVV